jgi:F-type H+-transporting ATPase subunit epsilon
MATTDRHVQCIVVTPERAVLDESCDLVVLPLFDGELGVLPGRAPLIGRLGYGELRLRRGPRVDRYYVDGGFAQVRANVVTVLTHQALRAEEINQSKAGEMLASHHGLAVNAEARASRQKDQERARAQLRVARKGQAPAHA